MMYYERHWIPMKDINVLYSCRNYLKLIYPKKTIGLSQVEGQSTEKLAKSLQKFCYKNPFKRWRQMFYNCSDQYGSHILKFKIQFLSPLAIFQALNNLCPVATLNSYSI